MISSKGLVAGALAAGLVGLALTVGGVRNGGHATEGSGSPAYLRGVRIVEVQHIGRPSDVMIGVPQSALIHDGGAPRVWVLEADGGLALRPIATGRCSGNFIETVRGLKLGDRVIARGMLFEAASTLNPGEAGEAHDVPIANGRCNRRTTMAVRAVVPDEARPE